MYRKWRRQKFICPIHEHELREGLLKGVGIAGRVGIEGKIGTTVIAYSIKYILKKK